MKEHLKLYMLRYASGRLYKTDGGANPPSPVYFSSKDMAKRHRDRLNASGSGGEKVVVSIGPDHRRFRSGTTA